MRNNVDITAAVLEVLRSSVNLLMAFEIVHQLQVAGHKNADKKVVNHLLYRPLKEAGTDAYVIL
jgi:hypothetical protein